MLEKPTVFVVDDHEELLQSMKFVIEPTGLPVETFTSARQFLDERHWDRAGCLILDIQMDGMSGIELQNRLIDAESLMPIIVMTAHASVIVAVKTLTNGAFYFLEKPFSEKMLLDLISKAIKKNLLDRAERARIQSVKSRLSKLTAREYDVLQRVIGGQSNKEIARELSLSDKTIEVHRGHMMGKVQALNVADLTAMVHGLVPPIHATNLSASTLSQ